MAFVRRHRLRVLQRVAIRRIGGAADRPEFGAADQRGDPGRRGARGLCAKHRSASWARRKPGAASTAAGVREQVAFEIVANAGGVDIGVRFVQQEDGALKHQRISRILAEPALRKVTGGPRWPFGAAR